MTFRVMLCVGFFVCTLGAESVAGMLWKTPAGWTYERSRPMRAATYTVPAAPGDAAGSECVVYFFGAGQGGSVEANLERWKGQFQQNGKPSPARVEKRTIHGLPVTTIDISGDYSGMAGPGAAEQKTGHGYRLLGAVVEGPGGTVFIKFAAPEKTVAANQKKFEGLLESFAKE
jgi:hypothetical protein